MVNVKQKPLTKNVVFTRNIRGISVVFASKSVWNAKLHQWSVAPEGLIQQTFSTSFRWIKILPPKDAETEAYMEESISVFLRTW